MSDRDVSKPYIDTEALPDHAAGHYAEDAVDREGYDDAQRAEIAEFEGRGPTDGVLMTDLLPDMGGDLDDEEVEDGGVTLDSVIDADGNPVE